MAISWKSWSRREFCRPRCVAFSETIRHRALKSAIQLRGISEDMLFPVVESPLQFLKVAEGCEAVLAHLNEGTSEGDAN